MHVPLHPLCPAPTSAHLYSAGASPAGRPPPQQRRRPPAASAIGCAVCRTTPPGERVEGAGGSGGGGAGRRERGGGRERRGRSGEAGAGKRSGGREGGRGGVGSGAFGGEERAPSWPSVSAGTPYRPRAAAAATPSIASRGKRPTGCAHPPRVCGSGAGAAQLPPWQPVGVTGRLRGGRG